MRILALDTALAACQVALWAQGRVLAQAAEPMVRGHSEALLPMVERVLRQAKADFADLDRIAVTVGPGTFTGLRIGLAAARGFALATALPLVGVTTLEAVAAAAALDFPGRPILAALDAGRGDLFVQVFAPDLAAVSEIMALPPEGVPALLPAGPTVAAGNGALRLREVAALPPDIAWAAEDGLPDLGQVAALAAGREPGPAHDVAPVYVLPHYARLPEGGRQRR